MKKRLIIASLFVLVINFTARAHEDDTANGVHLSELHTILGVSEPTLLPGSTWYFVKNIGRGIRLFFAFDPAKKAELELKFADEKLAEMGKALAKDPDKKSLEQALQNYLDVHTRLKMQLESLKGKNKNVDKLLEKLDARVKKHQELFEGLKSRVGAEATEGAKKELMEVDKKGKELMEEKMKEMGPKEEKMMKGGKAGEKMMEKTMKESSVSVVIDNFSFKEPELHIPVGATVRWANKDKVGHTVTSEVGKFGSTLLSKDMTFEHTFSEKGVFPYHCSPHPFMQGKVIVE